MGGWVCQGSRVVRGADWQGGDADGHRQHSKLHSMTTAQLCSVVLFAGWLAVLGE